MSYERKYEYIIIIPIYVSVLNKWPKNTISKWGRGGLGAFGAAQNIIFGKTIHYFTNWGTTRVKISKNTIQHFLKILASPQISKFTKNFSKFYRKFWPMKDFKQSLLKICRIFFGYFFKFFLKFPIFSKFYSKILVRFTTNSFSILPEVYLKILFNIFKNFVKIFL